MSIARVHPVQWVRRQIDSRGQVLIRVRANSACIRPRLNAGFFAGSPSPVRIYLASTASERGRLRRGFAAGGGDVSPRNWGHTLPCYTPRPVLSLFRGNIILFQCRIPHLQKSPGILYRSKDGPATMVNEISSFRLSSTLSSVFVAQATCFWETKAGALVYIVYFLHKREIDRAEGRP
jgi:hypothetical protein